MAENATLEYIKRDLSDLKDAVFGNGTPGIKMQVHEHTLIIAAWKETAEHLKKVFFGVMATLIAAAIIAVTATLVTAYKTVSSEELLQRLEKKVVIQPGVSTDVPTR